MTPATVDFGAFVPGPRHTIAAKGHGPLDGLDFAVKDLIDIAGERTGSGNPDWLASHPPAARSSPTVDKLLRAGACLTGKTITDQLAFSLDGINVHYGTPVNPAAPGCIPGGSSSGSAAAVSGACVDFALGTDTGGSVRIPAAFCGIYGFRPSHGRLPLDGVMPFAPSYDTVGWFARDADTLARIGNALLGDSGPLPNRMMLARDALQLATAETQNVLEHAVGQLGNMRDVAAFDSDAATYRQTYHVMQGSEVWAGLGPWITRNQPTFGQAVQRRFDATARITRAEVAYYTPIRARIRSYLDDVIGTDGILILPTAPFPAPTLDADLSDFYQRALALTSIAGHGGLPQVTLPLECGSGPIGLSMIAAHGADTGLLSFGATLASALLGG